MVATGLTPFFIYNYIKNNYYDKGKDELILEIFFDNAELFYVGFYHHSVVDCCIC